MTVTDEHQLEKSVTSAAGPTTTHILPLISHAGNKRLLSDWVDSRENYILLGDSHDILTSEYDCLIVDRRSLLTHRKSLIERKEREDLVLPIILIVEESEERRIRRELRQDHSDLYALVNAVVSMPIPEYRFADRIDTLLQTREQSRTIVTQRNQLQTIRDEHAGHGVVITDREGRIQYVNTAFEQQSGYTKEEVIGKTPGILQSGKHDDSFYEDMWETILAGEVWHGEVINQHKDGERYVLNQTIAPVTNLEGEIDRFIAVNHEITQLKELEDSLRSQSEQLEILNRVLRHDIRNDLNVILGWMDVIKEHVGEDGDDYTERIENAAKHIVELTDVAGDLVEDITNGSDPDLEPVEICHVLEVEVEKRREAFSQATIELHDEAPPETEVWANSLLASVFRNLLNNAIHHNNSSEPRVEIRSKLTEDSFIIRVADNGPGIPNNEKNRIFGKSQKGLDSEGTGIGLFLVRSLVDTYGGDVWIEDNEPEGAVFAVELPAVKGDPTAGRGDL